MDTPSRQELAARARRAYEFGRLRRALLGVWPVLPIAVVAAVVGEVATSLVLALVLAGAAVILFHRGRGLDRAVEAGFKAGIIPMVVALTMWEGQGCSGPASSWCLPLCAGSSVLVGAWLGVRLGSGRRVSLAAAALLISVLTAALGCAVLGLGSLLGVAAGLGLGMTPAWLMRASEARA